MRINHLLQDKGASGISLMEIIATLVIISLIIVGSLVLYQSSRSSAAATRLISDAIGIRMGVSHIFKSPDDDVTDDAGDIIAGIMWNSKNLPSTIKGEVDSSGKVLLTHQLGGRVHFGSRNQFIFTDIPSDVCILMLSMIGTEWLEIRVYDASDGSEWVTFPIPLNEIEKYCSLSDSMTIEFIFKTFAD